MGRTVWWGRHMQTRNANLVIEVPVLAKNRTEQEMRDLDSSRGDSRRENA
jgi:hypothetical protein